MTQLVAKNHSNVPGRYPCFSYWGMFAKENYAQTTVALKHPGSLFLGSSTLDLTVERSEFPA
jgi:hypothetical protein